jgi:hypothetical protein
VTFTAAMASAFRHYATFFGLRSQHLDRCGQNVAGAAFRLDQHAAIEDFLIVCLGHPAFQM